MIGTVKRPERKTYAVRSAHYELNPNKLFNVVTDLHSYIEEKAQKRTFTPAISLMGKGRKLVICAEAVDRPGTLSSFDLAKLVLSSDAKRLTLDINSHPKCAIDPEDIYYIANEYRID